MFAQFKLITELHFVTGIQAKNMTIYKLSIGGNCSDDLDNLHASSQVQGLIISCDVPSRDLLLRHVSTSILNISLNDFGPSISSQSLHAWIGIMRHAIAAFLLLGAYNKIGPRITRFITTRSSDPCHPCTLPSPHNTKALVPTKIQSPSRALYGSSLFGVRG